MSETNTIRTKVTDEELAEILALAEAQERTITQWLRVLVRAELRRVRESRVAA